MKTHSLNDKELFGLVELVRHVNHWNDILRAKIGYIGQQHNLDPEVGELKLELNNKRLTYESYKKPGDNHQPKK